MIMFRSFEMGEMGITSFNFGIIMFNIHKLIIVAVSPINWINYKLHLHKFPLPCNSYASYHNNMKIKNLRIVIIGFSTCVGQINHTKMIKISSK